MGKVYKAAIYLRISKEDKDERNSIASQKEITLNYAKRHNYEIVDEYVDNGYSGILSSRPALDKLMIDILRKNINMVIVKDMSRLTRDKNLTAYFTDIFFPDNDVRLISVTEYVDTGERYEIDDVVALRGIINQSYLEDISKKIKAVKTEFKKQGKFIENSVPYGYIKDKEDKHKLVIDEEAAKIIKYIYTSYLEGVKPYIIAENLNKEKIKTPSQYQNLKHQAKYWTNKIINRILSNPIYTGRLPINRLQNDFKLKKVIVTSNNNLEYCENSHDAIICIEDYEMVQEKRSSRVKKEPETYLYLLKGLVYCGNCGCRLTYKNEAPVKINSKGVVTGKKNKKGRFVCEEHNRHLEVCNSKDIKISEHELNEIVLKTLSKRLMELKIERYGSTIEKQQLGINPEMAEKQKLKQEINVQEKIFKTLYQKKVEGLISAEEFKVQYAQYQSRINEYKERLRGIEEKKSNQNVESSMDTIIKHFVDCEGFDNSILQKLIEKIEVGKNNKIEILMKV